MKSNKKEILRSIIRESIQELQNEHDETNVSNNSEEKREVQIGKEIIHLTAYFYTQDKGRVKLHDALDKIKKLAQELIDMHKNMEEVAPPGWEGTVKAMKKHKKEIDNPWALAWSMKNKGMKSHK